MTTVTLLNPLPNALSHYESALVAVLLAGGHGATVAQWPSVEVQGRGRAITALRLLRAKAALPPGRSHLLLWPALGWIDTLERKKTLMSIIVHDPEALRSQAFLSAGLGRVVARAPAGYRADIIVHSQRARDVLEGLGFKDIAHLPHPAALAPVAPRVRRQPIVRVLGAYKPARDLVLLTRLARQLPTWTREIHGRGWPSVDGWSVHQGFQGEEQLDALIDSAGVVLIPYSRYFQSGIAVRALERGTPVVGQVGSYVGELFGAGYPGLAQHPDDWVQAIGRALQMGDVMSHALRYTEAAVAAWAVWADQEANR
jgi:hypothetical protein